MSVGAEPDTPCDHVVNAGGAYLLPGFIQTHVHLCQTLFRSYADDMPLLEWLRRRIWPMEAAHSPSTLRAAARLAAAELLLSGTTTALTMETVHDTDVVFETLAEIGLRATVGKCMMDSDDDVPARLREQTAAVDRRERRAAQAVGGRGRRTAARRLRAALCGLLLARSARGGGRALGAATASSSTRTPRNRATRSTSCAGCRAGCRTSSTSRRPASRAIGLCAAHCVWVSEAEQALLAERDVKVMHCPGSNLKLGSGIAPVVEMRQRGISVSLGADGAACNNRLDMFDEMRLAATLQAVRHAPGALTARDALWMATREGARALGLEDEVGSIEPGKRADLILVDRDRAHLAPDADPWSTLVYAARGTDVRMTMVDGEILVDGFGLARLDADRRSPPRRRQAARGSRAERGRASDRSTEPCYNA